MARILLVRGALVALSLLVFSSFAIANCTQGFWKNHPEDWCLTSLMLGDVQYDQGELLSILNQSVEGNGLVSMSHQLIAAKLNAACGAAVAPEAAEADLLIGPLVVPPVGNGFLPTETTSSLNDALDAYNNLPGDQGGFGGCAPIAVEEFTWGRIKASYR